jgi:hypothetical protein
MPGSKRKAPATKNDNKDPTVMGGAEPVNKKSKGQVDTAPGPWPEGFHQVQFCNIITITL